MIQTLFGSVEQEPTLLERLKSGVEKTRAGLVTRLEDALAGRKEIDSDLLDELEYTLVSADIGIQTTTEILERIRQQVNRKLVGDATELRGLIRQHLLEILQEKLNLFDLVAGETGLILGERFTSEDFEEEIFRRWQQSEGDFAGALAFSFSRRGKSRGKIGII